jgi:hypothetical protein
MNTLIVFLILYLAIFIVLVAVFAITIFAYYDGRYLSLDHARKGIRVNVRRLRLTPIWPVMLVVGIVNYINKIRIFIREDK